MTSAPIILQPAAAPNLNADLTTWLTQAFARDALERRTVRGEQAERYRLVAGGMSHADAIEAVRSGNGNGRVKGKQTKRKKVMR